MFIFLFFSELSWHTHRIRQKKITIPYYYHHEIRDEEKKNAQKKITHWDLSVLIVVISFVSLNFTVYLVCSENLFVFWTENSKMKGSSTIYCRQTKTRIATDIATIQKTNDDMSEAHGKSSWVFVCCYFFLYIEFNSSNHREKNARYETSSWARSTEPNS